MNFLEKLIKSAKEENFKTKEVVNFRATVFEGGRLCYLLNSSPKSIAGVDFQKYLDSLESAIRFSLRTFISNHLEKVDAVVYDQIVLEAVHKNEKLLSSFFDDLKTMKLGELCLGLVFKEGTIKELFGGFIFIADEEVTDPEFFVRDFKRKDSFGNFFFRRV